MSDANWRFHARGNQVFCKFRHDGEEMLICTVSKTEAVQWASWIAGRMNIAQRLKAGGLNLDEIEAIARMTYQHFKPVDDKENTPN